MLKKILLLAITNGIPVGNNLPTHKWNVGNCIQYQDPDKEEWEEAPNVYKIEKIGKRHYLYNLYTVSNKEWSKENFSELFWLLESSNFKKVDCPK